MTGLVFKDLKVYMGSFIALLFVLIFANGYVLLPALFAGTENFQSSLSGIDALPGLMCASSVFMSFYISGMFQENLVMHDEQKKWAYFMVSADDGVKKMVGSKYITMLLYSMITLFGCVIMNLLVADILGADTPNTAGLAVVLFYLQLLLRAVGNPFIFAFSSKYGNSVRVGTFFVLLAAAGVYALFGDLSWIDMDTIWEKLLSFMEDINSSYKLMWVQVIFFGGVIILYILSYKISCKLYLKGVAHYDK